MPNNTKLCSFEGCGRKVKSFGLCDGHYLQKHRRGVSLSPLGGRSRTTGMTDRERFDHYVDRSPGCHVWSGAKNAWGYGSFRVASKTMLAHRVAYERANGPISLGLVIDHICHNRLCVKLSHLRLVNDSQSAQNKAGAYSGNQSGYRGVTWNPDCKKWVANVKCGGVGHYLGLFDDRHEAGAVALAKRLELFTHSDGR